MQREEMKMWSKFQWLLVGMIVLVFLFGIFIFLGSSLDKAVAKLIIQPTNTEYKNKTISIFDGSGTIMGSYTGNFTLIEGLPNKIIQFTLDGETQTWFLIPGGTVKVDK
jgi:hypothetical protein